MALTKLDTKQMAKDFVYTPTSNVNKAYGSNFSDADVQSLQQSIAKKYGIGTTPTQPAQTGSMLYTQDDFFGKKKNIFDLYGMELSDQPKISDPWAAYGLEKPVYTAPDTSVIDAEIDKYKPVYNPAEIEANLQKDLDAIKAKYDIERANAAALTENERKSQISNLYDVGFVNPASSGLTSIGSASNETLNRRNDAISAMENAEKNSAVARAYGLKQEAQKNALSFAQNKKAEVEAKAQEAYQRSQNDLNTSIGMINGIVSAWQAGKAISNEEKGMAQKNVSTLLSEFGSGAFDGMDMDEINKLESAAGYPAGSLVKGIKSLKEKELEAAKTQKELNLREVDGSLYNISIDENGNIKTELVLKTNKPVGGGGGGASAKKVVGDYFTRPKPDGTIGYYFGDEKNWETAQELTSQQYLQGKSSAQGVLNPENNKNEQFLSKDWFVNNYGKKELVKQAKNSGYGKLFKSSETEVDNYLNDIEKTINTFRSAGHTDKEILQMMLKGE